MNQFSDSFAVSTERIKLTLKSGQGKAEEQTELPLKLLAIGKFQGEGDGRPLPERSSVNIDKNSFNTVMHKVSPRLQITVPNLLMGTAEGDRPSALNVDICLRSLDDFHPDHLIRQVPSLDRLFALRDLLVDLRCYPDRRECILDLIARLVVN